MVSAGPANVQLGPESEQRMGDQQASVLPDNRVYRPPGPWNMTPGGSGP